MNSTTKPASAAPEREPNPFTDEAVAGEESVVLLPHINPKHPGQHWFIGNGAGAVIGPDNYELAAVWWAGHTTADIFIIHAGGHTAITLTSAKLRLAFPGGSASIELTSAQLRDVAARLAAMADYMDAPAPTGGQP